MVSFRLERRDPEPLGERLDDQIVDVALAAPRRARQPLLQRRRHAEERRRRAARGLALRRRPWARTRRRSAPRGARRRRRSGTSRGRRPRGQARLEAAGMRTSTSRPCQCEAVIAADVLASIADRSGCARGAELAADVQDALHDRDPGGRASRAIAQGSTPHGARTSPAEITTTRSAREPIPTSPRNPSASAFARAYGTRNEPAIAAAVSASRARCRRARGRAPSPRA